MDKFKVKIPNIGMCDACFCPECGKLCAIKIPATMHRPEMVECRSNDHVAPCHYYGGSEQVDKSVD